VVMANSCCDAAKPMNHADDRPLLMPLGGFLGSVCPNRERAHRLSLLL
jgi:hypothetical protein